MSVVLGEGTFRYEVAEGWGELPAGWRYGDVGAVGIDRKDNVYVFNRGPHPMIVYDRNGRFLRSWGEGIFHRAHGLHMGPDDTIFLTDDGDAKGRPVGVAIDKTGALLVADDVGNTVWRVSAAPR